MEDSAFIEIGLPIALAIVMIGIGLTLTADDFKAQSRSWKAIGLGTVAQCVAVPGFALLVASLVNAPPEIAVGLVLAAATPGGATSNLTAFLGRGNVALAIVLTVITSIVVILTLPLWVNLALRVWGGEIVDGGDARVPLMDIVTLLLSIIFIPVGIGLTIKRTKPALAARLERMVSAFSVLVLTVLIVGILIDLGSDALPMLRAAGPACLLIAIGACGIAFALGAVARLPKGDTISIACEVVIKNITLGLLIGLTVLESEAMALPSAIYGLVMYIPVAGVIWLGRRWLPAPAAPSSAGV